ncbi:hypothetical protein WJX72_000874 [[Myrmecia] bisecta]|uniref:C3H1-type domain-containing protein n=1 Tax=[Myrmecia] bisecta TaxID=41462 RepID=A0AAW1Q6F6_9CHLO
MAEELPEDAADVWYDCLEDINDGVSYDGDCKDADKPPADGGCNGQENQQSTAVLPPFPASAGVQATDQGAQARQGTSTGSVGALSCSPATPAPASFPAIPAPQLRPVRTSRDASVFSAASTSDSPIGRYSSPSHTEAAAVDPVTPESVPEFNRLHLDDPAPLEDSTSTSGRNRNGEAMAVHRAAFDGNVDEVLRLLASQEDPTQLHWDPQGNTVLHIAVLRRHYNLVDTLLAADVPLKTPNSRGWLAIDEAIALKDARLVKALHTKETADLKKQIKAKKAYLLATMQSMPDYGFKLRWELGSPIFWMLLRKYAPHDTYQVWKKGTCIRVDGSLMGMDDKARSLIPKWKRGHFSLLFDGGPTPSRLYLVDHNKQTYVDLTSERKQHKPDIDAEVRIIMSEGAGKSKMKPVEFRFKPAKTWLGNDATERIEGWKTRVFEATGKMVAITTTMAPLVVPKTATFEEYLRLEPQKDQVNEVMVDPLSMGGPAASPGGASQAEDEEGALDEETAAALAKLRAKSGRKLSGKCWMAEDFPMSLSQLLPVMDVIGNANKHLARVAKFLQKYGDMSLFPVKLQVPLLMTVYLLVSFRQFHQLGTSDPAQQDSFYKTELCRSWEETGSCRYGGKCQFAHGPHELRPVQRHPKYKTEVCRTFANTGTCPYGTRCRFIHRSKDAALSLLSPLKDSAALTSPTAAGPASASAVSLESTRKARSFEHPKDSSEQVGLHFTLPAQLSEASG